MWILIISFTSNLIVYIRDSEGWIPPVPSEMCDFHSQSQGMCWYFRTADRGRVISLPREKRLLDILESEFDSGSTSNLFDNPGFDIMIATISWRQMHKTIIFCLNLARQLQTNNEQTRTQNRPTCWQLASEVDPHLHMVRAAPSRVAWDFDSPWITGPMTAHQSVAYVRHIILAPAANLCTPSAIVFLPIRAWIWRHIRRYLDGSAILLTVNGPVWPSWLKISPCVTTKIMWSETAFR